MTNFENYPRVTPFLWFDSNAEEAVEFYLSVFRNSKRLGGVAGQGKPMTISFELDGQVLTALNGGPHYKFNEAVSFVVRCDNQQEVDEYWSKLSEGGSDMQCGWLKDKFGVTWQIVPSRLPELIGKPKVMDALMKMKKLDIAALERAAQA